MKNKSPHELGAEDDEKAGGDAQSVGAAFREL